MTAIRPDLSPFAPRASTTSPGAQNAAHTAQAAFFRMALGQTTTATPAAPAISAAPPRRKAATPAQVPWRRIRMALLILFAIIVLSIWQAVGFHMVIWLSGLQTIPMEQYEAVAIDGASRWQLFRYITWPGLRQTRTFILVTITIAALGLFTQIQVMTQGGPLDSTSTLVFLAVRTGFQQQQTGYASAMSLVFFVLVLAVSLVQRYLTRDKELQR